MKDIPLLFKPEMILAIDEDRKTQTRRIKFNASVGDHLWIKEHHWMWGKYRWTGGYTKTGKKKMEFCDMTCSEHPVIFSLEKNGILHVDVAYGESIGYHPRTPLFMPKKYARKWLEVTGVRVELLQNISEEDAINEGMPSRKQAMVMAADSGLDWYNAPTVWFKRLWDSINADRAPWESNPWVWVIEFKRIKP